MELGLKNRSVLITGVTLFLASDQAAYVTGAVIPMDGGINPII